MDRTMVKKFRWFWPWQDEAEEAWLGEMSQKGYHLSSVGLLGRYTFSIAGPRDYVYRLDYQTFPEKDKQEYLQLFRDAGWEHIGEMSAWQYFRKGAKQRELNEIFTDVESKVAKYKRVLTFVGFFLLIEVIFVAVFTDNIWGDSPYSWWGVMRAISLLIMLVVLFLTYAAVRLILRIRQLRRL
jgi:hypothetical protein